MRASEKLKRILDHHEKINGKPAKFISIEVIMILIKMHEEEIDLLKSQIETMQNTIDRLNVEVDSLTMKITECETELNIYRIE